MIEMSIDDSEMQKATELLSGMPEKLKRVQTRALREAGKVIASGIKQSITQKYYVKGKTIQRATSVKTESGSAIVRLRDKRHLLSSYLMRPKKAPVKRPKSAYVYGGIRRGEEQIYPRSFLLPKNNMPLMRVGRGRRGTLEGTEKIKGPAVSEIASESEVTEEVKAKAMSRMNQQIRYWTLRELGLAR